ncbi:MAG: hypothetical protein K0R15_2876 [Clostridiales bacterium]|jgi:hypothetical protein|nr:hypothetical protein [Clostridiales bacterium]
MFKQLLGADLKNHLAPFITNVDTWFDFRYTWFLTSLYHDTATVLEQIDWNRGCPSDLDFYLGKYDILYNLYVHKWSIPTIKPYTYSEILVRNYFKYRTEYCHKIDHRIIAGSILYDRLVKTIMTFGQSIRKPIHTDRMMISIIKAYIGAKIICRILLSSPIRL